MVPNVLVKRFESKSTLRWMIKIEGIDSFLAKRVELPQFKRRPTKVCHDKGKNCGLDVSTMHVEFCNTTDVELNKDLCAWMASYDVYRACELCYLDQNGTLIERWKMRVFPHRLSFTPLDYAERPVQECTSSTFVEFNVEFEGIEYPTAR